VLAGALVVVVAFTVAVVGVLVFLLEPQPLVPIAARTSTQTGRRRGVGTGA
jgi:hypothetical protein